MSGLCSFSRALRVGGVGILGKEFDLLPVNDSITLLYCLLNSSVVIAGGFPWGWCGNYCQKGMCGLFRCSHGCI